MTVLTLADARTLAGAILSAGATRGFQPLAVAVLDAGGRDLVVLRDERAGFYRAEIARAKATSCLGMGQDGADLADRARAAPVRLEGDVYGLEVVGTIPPELDGAYIRNSADHAFPPMYANDLFLNGDGMLHKVRIKDGAADLSTRYVQTEKLKLERAARRALFGAYRNKFTDDSSVADKDRSTANTSVVFHGNKLLALKEAARPMRIDPETLETLGTYDFDGRLASETFTAHPKLDPRTGEMVAYGYFTQAVADNVVELYYIDASGELTRTERFEAPYPSMIHDCLLSEHYVVFTICPMVCDWERVKRGEAFFHWDDRLPTKVGVVPRRPGDASSVRWFTAPRPLMETHTLNAWEEGDKLHLEHFVTETGWLSQFPDINDPQAQEKPPFAQRWTVDLASNEDGVAIEQMWGHIGEMPMVDLRFATRRTRHFWFGTNNMELGPMLPRGAKGPPFTCLGHFDAETNKLDFILCGTEFLAGRTDLRAALARGGGGRRLADHRRRPPR